MPDSSPEKLYFMVELFTLAIAVKRHDMSEALREVSRLLGYEGNPARLPRLSAYLVTEGPCRDLLKTHPNYPQAEVLEFRLDEERRYVPWLG